MLEFLIFHKKNLLTVRWLIPQHIAQWVCRISLEILETTWVWLGTACSICCCLSRGVEFKWPPEVTSNLNPSVVPGVFILPIDPALEMPNPSSLPQKNPTTNQPTSPETKLQYIMLSIAIIGFNCQAAMNFWQEGFHNRKKAFFAPYTICLTADEVDFIYWNCYAYCSVPSLYIAEVTQVLWKFLTVLQFIKASPPYTRSFCAGNGSITWMYI